MTRDMTAAQFAAALKRNGFKRYLLWAEHKDIPNRSFGILIRSDGNVARRATIANLIKRRDEELARLRAASTSGRT